MDQDLLWASFRSLVNMGPTELERWLRSEDSQAAGAFDGEAERRLRDGRRIVRMMRKGRAGFSQADWKHVARVVGEVRVRRAMTPSGSAAVLWRHGLMNRGHDPSR